MPTHRPLRLSLDAEFTTQRGQRFRKPGTLPEFTKYRDKQAEAMVAEVAAENALRSTRFYEAMQTGDTSFIFREWSKAADAYFFIRPQGRLGATQGRGQDPKLQPYTSMKHHEPEQGALPSNAHRIQKLLRRAEDIQRQRIHYSDQHREVMWQGMWACCLVDGLHLCPELRATWPADVPPSAVLAAVIEQICKKKLKEEMQ